MLRMAGTDLKIMLQKSAVRLVLPILFGMFLVTLVVSVLFGRAMDGPEKQLLLCGLIVSIWSLVVVYLTVREIPLRIVPGVFACAAGPAEKMRYIRIQFGIKYIISVLLMLLTNLIGNGKCFFFFYEDAKGAAVQIFICLFLLWNLNLRVGIGEGVQRELDENGYEKLSRDEFLVNTVWFGILVTEAMIFLCRLMYMVLALEKPPVMTGAECAAWVAVMLGNAGFAACCTPRILKMTLAYEKIYLPGNRRGDAT